MAYDTLFSTTTNAMRPDMNSDQSLLKGVKLAASDVAKGFVRTEDLFDGWVRLWRFTEAQTRAFTSVLAWHPGIFRQMARASSGIRLEFTTDSNELALEIVVEELPEASRVVVRDVLAVNPNTPRPFDGISVDIDGVHRAPVLPDDTGILHIQLGQKPSSGTTLPISGLAPEHSVRIWLPALTGCMVRTLSGDGSYIRPCEAKEQLLVLGDSIAQGFSAGDAGLSWPAQLADLLGMDLINQGLGGQVFQPGSLYGLNSCIEPTHVVVELGINYRFEACGETVVGHDIKAFLAEVESAWPTAELWVLTPTFRSEALRPTHPRSCFSQLNELIARAIPSGETCHVVDGLWLMDANIELLADHSDHPTAEGMTQIAERLSLLMSGGAPKTNMRERAIEILEQESIVALPMLEPLRRGYGEVLFAEPGCVFARLTNRSQIIYATDRKLARRVLSQMATRELMMVCGENIVRDVERVMGYDEALPCHLVVYESDDLLPRNESCTINALEASHIPLVLEHYAHPEYLSSGELDRMILEGRMLGAFEGEELVGFIGVHEEGSIGLLEVFPGFRRKGYAAELVSEMVNQHLAKGYVPWGEIWPSNMASLRLQEKLGFSIYPARDLTFMGDFERGKGKRA